MRWSMQRFSLSSINRMYYILLKIYRTLNFIASGFVRSVVYQRRPNLNNLHHDRRPFLRYLNTPLYWSDRDRISSEHLHSDSETCRKFSSSAPCSTVTFRSFTSKLIKFPRFLHQLQQMLNSSSYSDVGWIRNFVAEEDAVSACHCLLRCGCSGISGIPIIRSIININHKKSLFVFSTVYSEH